MSLEIVYLLLFLGVRIVLLFGYLGFTFRRDLYLGFNVWCSRFDVSYRGSFEFVVGVRFVGLRVGVFWGLGL